MTRARLAGSFGAIALAVLARSGGAEAQPAVAPTTLLHLSTTASVSVPPDQLVAELVAQTTATSPATAQRQVNDTMARGMQAARSVQSVDATAIGYEVSPVDPQRGGWTARQALELRGADGPALLDLTARLQAQGFITASLDWRLSPALRRKSQDEAMVQALKRMQDEAAAAAGALGLHVDHLQDVRLQPNEFIPPRPMTALAARAAPPPPEATAAPQDVTVAVSAEVVLRP